MITILTGNVLDTLPTLPANSVQCCVTSPPYWGLRDYGTGTWEGGDAGCDHATGKTARNDGGVGGRNGPTSQAEDGGALLYRDTCGKCGARRIDQQLGSEATPQEYVANMVAVFREVRRVLREDGVLFLNLGDSYAQSGGKQEAEPLDVLQERAQRKGYDVGAWGAKTRNGQGIAGRAANTAVSGLKPKDLCGIPWRVAFALQEDGWWLRSEITWCKKAPMPESVTDRPTSATEKIFLLTKSARYFYDAEAVKEASVDPEGTAARYAHPFNVGKKELNGGGRPNGAHNTAGMKEWAGTRNQRNFWLLGPESYAGAHFATFPTEIPRRAILAGTSAHGACPTCGAPWERVVERTAYTPEVVLAGVRSVDDSRGDKTRKLNGKSEEWKLAQASAQTTGWQPTCTCDCKDGEREDTVPCVVLDPFTGSGTTGAVARTLGRDFIGCELNPEYVKLAEKRIGHAQPALFGI